MWAEEVQNTARPAQYTWRGLPRSRRETASTNVWVVSIVTGRPARRSTRANPVRISSGVATVSSRQELVQGEAHVVHVAAVLAQRAQGRRGGVDVELLGPQVEQGAGPIQALGHPGALDQLPLGAQALDEDGELLRQALGRLGQPPADDGDLALEAGVVDPVVQAPALERV